MQINQFSIYQNPKNFSVVRIKHILTTRISHLKYLIYSKTNLHIYCPNKQIFTQNFCQSNNLMHNALVLILYLKKQLASRNLA